MQTMQRLTAAGRSVLAFQWRAQRQITPCWQGAIHNARFNNISPVEFLKQPSRATTQRHIAVYASNQPPSKLKGPYNPSNRLITDNELNALLSPYGLKPKNYDLYRVAFIYKSYTYGVNSGIKAAPPEGCVPLQHEHNQRLEFLGDAVLDLVTAVCMFEDHPEAQEGELSSRRTQLVSNDAISRLASKLDLGQYMIISRNEEEAGSRQNTKFLANTFEAFVGAMYQDLGHDKTQQWLMKLIRDKYWV